MNTYNEHLSSTIRTLLLELELEQKKLHSQKEAAAFTHEYAKEASVTAQKKLTNLNSLLLFQQHAAEKLQVCQAISSATLSSANEANACSKIAVVNSSVAASNVQVAVNGILSLASDVGSLYSILGASDIGSDIYMQAETIHGLMNDTAYNAELASQVAMNASILAAEISSGAIADKAKNTNTQAVDLLNLLTDQCNATKEQQQFMASELNKTIAQEKQAQQQAERTTVEHVAAQEAYRFASRELNLNLQVHVSEKAGDGYTVSFDEYMDPFPEDQSEKDNGPAESYYIFLVKEQKKDTFTLSHAMACISSPGQSIQLKKRANSAKTVFKKEIAASDLLDSDGNPIKTEQAYVIVVLVQLNDRYKKMLNDFDDLLTAPSARFTLNIAVHKTLTDHTVSEKQQDLYVLGVEVLYAQQKVEQCQQIKTDLTENFSVRQAYLDVTKANTDEALNTKNIGDQLVQNAMDLKNNSDTALRVATAAKTKANETAQHAGIVIDQLIYVAKAIDKLGSILIRKKAVNPLISDDLIAMATNAGRNAGNAVSLFMVALKSAFTTLSGITETEAIMALEYAQAVKLYDSLTMDKDRKKLSALSFKTTLHQNYDKHATKYKLARLDLDKAIKKLNSASTKLNGVQIKSQSLEMGLAAATAAAGAC